MDFFEIFLSLSLQQEILCLSAVVGTFFFGLSLYIEYFRRNLKIDQLVSIKIKAEELRLCRVLRIPDDKNSVVAVDIEDSKVWIVSRNRVYLAVPGPLGSF